MSHRALGPQFLSRAELKQLHSGDFGDAAMGSKSVRKRWLADARNEPQGRHRDHGGPEGYLAHLTEQIRQEGIREPLEIRHTRGRQVLDDGHHRAFAALDLGLKRIPYRDVGD